jgi:RNA polymerase sigma-70 factor (ECF subfamily)
VRVLARPHALLVIHLWTPSVQFSQVANSSERADDVLIAALAERDLTALAALYDRYGRLAYALAYRILGEGPAAEDVVHDAYISAWRGAGSYRRERGNVRGWLMSIVHHRAVDVLRRKTTFRPAPLEAAAERPADDDTAEAAERNVEHQTVREALEGLPQAQRRTIELAYFGGYTHVELAELMGVPLGTVKGRMRIGLQKLRRALEHEGSYREHTR